MMTLSLREAATTVGYCVEHILRLFKKDGLESPAKEWKKIKLIHASNLLLNTDYSVEAIIEHVGYENRSYFHKQFRQRFGTTPKRYRAENRE